MPKIKPQTPQNTIFFWASIDGPSTDKFLKEAWSAILKVYDKPQPQMVDASVGSANYRQRRCDICTTT
jgi:hypothetical protein